ncbi:16S rRNA (uracil1498-N3)-methyltransferase [Melghiribacillus thermohalophilus]|uniref:Ribosomal RNA small subunit methyltransferase E n=1 Tax=Melghiribacillus thermohalophilus TaxID=1324956 RepID=A0A4R3NBI8_9BACI|nr:16S rRNA (uracil(1498)-N(3))-methyltransferase [Melghiribacillus thermohalophilus]TCT27029.1 16S rRNA (uracil1498-N3)-methyltransferase [Melghiribacillus thermohalophilus]
MQRYFVPASNWMKDGRQVMITGDDARHIVKVMRMNTGDEVICCDGTGSSALCRIEEISSKQVLCHIVKWIHEEKELPVKVTIVQGLPKGDKLDLVVQKGTELGAHCFMFFPSERSVVKWDQNKMNKKISRLNRIAKEASEQSHRTYIPDVHYLPDLQQVFHKADDFAHKIAASELETGKDDHNPLKNILDPVQEGEHVLLMVGPEGGFSEGELRAMDEQGFSFARFGPRILRTETAPLYFLAAMSYHFEELR